MAKKRQVNFELLRIVAMFMIIALHYLVKGGAAVSYVENGAAANYAAWLVEAFCIGAVNCYVLISGYFLVESEWKPGRVASLFFQVLFYSALIPLLLILIGEVSPRSLGIYDWIGYLLPVDTEHYWFATAYLLMYLFAPLLAKGIRQMEKKELQVVLVLLLFFFSAVKTFVPVAFVTDHKGYDFGWFLCLFVLAGYIRRFGFSWLEKKANAALLYVVSSLGIWGLSMVSGRLGERIAAFTCYADMPYTYNHLLCVVSSVALFYLFKDSTVREGKFAALVTALAPYTFGIYLLHEHLLVRYRWPEWLGTERVAGSFGFLPHMVGCVVLVYVVGTVVDFVRAWIFEQIARVGKRGESRNGVR